MKKAISIACGALLVSCAPADEGTPPGEPAERVEGEAPDLSGHYRIEVLGDEPLPFPLQVSANTNSIWWEPACAAQGLSYRAAADGKVEFFDQRDPDEPQIVCDIGYPEELTTLWNRLKGVHKALLRADRSLLVTVDDQDWIFEAATDPLPDDLTGTWQVEEVNGLSTWEMRHIRLKADGAEIWWNPRCAGAIVEYTMEGENFAVTKPAYTPPPPPEEGEVPVPLKPVCAVGLPPYLTDAVNGIRAATAVKRDYENNLVLSGAETRAVLKAATPLD